MFTVRRLAIGIIALLVAVADVPEGVNSWQPWTMLAGLVAALALVTRERGRPLGASASLASLVAVTLGAHIVDEAGQIPFGLILVVGVLLADVARFAATRTVGLTAVAAVVAAAVVEGLAVERGWGDLALDITTWGFAMVAALAQRYRRQAQESQLERAKADERERIARELHDVVAHHVSAIAMPAEGARAVFATDPHRVDRSLDAIHHAAAVTLDEMRRMVSVLRDDEGETRFGTPSTSGGTAPLSCLSDLEAALATADDPPVDVTIERAVADPGPSVRAALFRIAQEATTNARRHARSATAVVVVVSQQDDSIRICITDDGRHGPSRGFNDGYGLIGMRERAQLLGGDFEAGPLPERGWKVTATIPLAGRQ